MRVNPFYSDEKEVKYHLPGIIILHAYALLG